MRGGWRQLPCACRPRKAMPSDAFMAIEFAQSKGQARQEGRTGVSFADVAGMDHTLQELQDIVEVRRNLGSHSKHVCDG